MTINEFNAAINGLVNTVIETGVKTGQCDFAQVVGVIEGVKFQVLNSAVNAPRPQIVKASFVPKIKQPSAPNT